MAKKKKKKAKKKKKGSRSGSRRVKPELSHKQMIARIPNKDWLTTGQVCYVWNECQPLRIYQLVREKRLKKYRTRNRGKQNIYKRKDVVALVNARFTPKPG